MSEADFIANQLGLPTAKVQAAINLFDQGNTIPFVARYRKEATGSLDEEQLRTIQAGVDRLRALNERRTVIVSSIESQGLLTDKLRIQLDAALTRAELEDLYAPYKPKRRTRASVALENGLGPLADLIQQQPVTGYSLEKIGLPFLSENVPTIELAFSGARDIVASRVNENAQVRSFLRQRALNWGVLRIEKIPDAQDVRGVYQDYYQYDAKVSGLRPHQILAINRGEAEKVLRISLLVADRDWQDAVKGVYLINIRSPLANQLELAVQDGVKRLLIPAIESDVRSLLRESAENHAISVFALNLRSLLLVPAIAGRIVLGIDPGYRTGCKLAVVDRTGKLLETATIYPHGPQNQWSESLEVLSQLTKKHQVTLVSIGNGTASRETEQLVSDFISNFPGVKYLIVNEAGASVYSASELARKEFPRLDVSMRGAVSIARRVLDPLAELVKIDPKSIGVGMYQHDVNQKELSKTLDGVVESVVNQVGVDLNTASPSLLTYVAGVGPKLAEKIVQHRIENGRFSTRSELRKIPGLGPKAFEQCAGFLRIPSSENPLDASAIHPESYKVAREVIKRAGFSFEMELQEREKVVTRLIQLGELQQISKEFSVGLPTLVDICEQLLRPGRDPRTDFPEPFLRSDMLTMEDLIPGTVLMGTVRNVVDFGAFVDIGVKQDGLLHRSQFPEGVVYKVGDIIQVEVLRIDLDRGRIGLGITRDL